VGIAGKRRFLAKIMQPTAALAAVSKIATTRYWLSLPGALETAFYLLPTYLGYWQFMMPAA
jgi:hypothetical protein